MLSSHLYLSDHMAAQDLDTANSTPQEKESYSNQIVLLTCNCCCSMVASCKPAMLLAMYPAWTLHPTLIILKQPLSGRMHARDWARRHRMTYPVTRRRCSGAARCLRDKYSSGLLANLPQLHIGQTLMELGSV